MKVEKGFATYKQSLALKELGFDEDCLAFYIKCEESNIYIPMLRLSKIEAQKIIDSANNIYNAEYTLSPLKQQVFRWFREKYEAYSTISTELEEGLYYRFFIQGNEPFVFFSGIFYTYEEAESACINKLIELVKQQENETYQISPPEGLRQIVQ